ncbi:type II toxin-antitoxin system VapC family toxin [Adonisia turfae]|nr:type II toxin-antitoxin system VapC family toxin [Adonisia turfae]
MADETSQIFPSWFALVTDNQIKGKRTHDVRIMAVMLTSDIGHILTLNPDDFSRVPGISIVHPQQVLEEATKTE